MSCKMHLRAKLPVGSIHGRWWWRLQEIVDPEIGPSTSIHVPMRYWVHEASSGFPAGVGRTMYRKYFADTPGLVLTVLFASSRPDLRRRSHFADPDSIWFNVFYGCYEIEVDAERWGRPFAYVPAAGHGEDAFTVHTPDLARIVKADWNLLSNGIYGVDADELARVESLGLSEVRGAYLGRISRPGWDRSFDLAELSDVTVVNPNCAHAPRGFVQRVWRLAFGTHAGARAVASSQLRLRAYVAWRREGNSFRTTVFGGCVNQRFDELEPERNARFLDLQMGVLEHALARQKGLGFRGR